MKKIKKKMFLCCTIGLISVASLTSPIFIANFNQKNDEPMSSTNFLQTEISSIIQGSNFDELLNFKKFGLLEAKLYKVLIENEGSDNFENINKEYIKDLLIKSELFKKESTVFAELIARGEFDKFESNFFDSVADFVLKDIKESLKSVVKDRFTVSPFKKELYSGNIFQSHFWIALGWKTAVDLANLYFVADQALPFALAGAQIFAGDWGGLTQTLAEYAPGLSSLAKNVFMSTVRGVSDFKKNSRCGWSYFVWGIRI